MDYENSNFGNTSNFESNNKINNIRINKDGQSRISDGMSNVLNSGLSSVINRENTQIKEKKIVNNKPSQFGPILGVNFHNVKK